MVFSVTTADSAALRVSTSGDVPSTVTLSSAAPTFSVRLSAACCATTSTTPFDGGAEARDSWRASHRCQVEDPAA